MDIRQRLRRDLADNDTRLDELAQQRARMIAAAESSNVDDEHDPEGATIAFEREQLGALIRLTQRHRDDVIRALAMLDAGTYGTCERCGEAISTDRLEARPTARTCIVCATLG